MGKTDCTHEHHKYLTLHGFIKRLSGRYFVLINKWCYPQSAFTHNPGPMSYLRIVKGTRSDDESMTFYL